MSAATPRPAAGAGRAVRPCLAARLGRAALLGLALGLGACALPFPAPPPAEAPRAPLPPSPPPAIHAPLERDVHERVNRERAQRGLPALRYDERLAAIARGHSVSIASGREPFSHGGFHSRADAADRALGIRAMSENLALNNDPAERTAAAAVDGWMESPGHRENLLGPYELTGVGVARTGNGTYYYTQLFVTLRAPR